MDTLNYTEQFLQNYSYLGVVLLIFAFSFVIPLSKTLVIVGAGVLASQGYGTASLYFIMALLSMLLADSVYYLLGRGVGIQIMQWPVFKKRQRQFDLAGERFRQHAWLTIFTSRYLPYVRIFIYIIAGINRMPYWVFLSANFITTFIYTLAFLYLGYSLAANQQLLLSYVDEAELYISAVAIVLVLAIIIRYRRQHRT